MKTGYEKPQIQFANFELSESISAGCEVFSNHGENLCDVYITEPGWGDVIIYSDGCSYPAPNPDDTPCYHGPSDYSVYSS